MIIDRHNRVIDYVRIAITDKCNLRCHYCMPEDGISFVPKRQLLSYEEILRIVSLLSKQGVRKVRITGGEPFLRKNVMSLFRSLATIDGLESIALTTNGTETKDHLAELYDLGIHKINLSLDSFNPDRFRKITRRDHFSKVWDTLTRMIEMGFDVKLNCVVMSGENTEDIVPMVAFTKEQPVAVRFIEEMPFNGTGKRDEVSYWSYLDILQEIERHFGMYEKRKDAPNSTSQNYQLPNAKGSFGVIPAYSRTFCGTCNRIRLTPEGVLKSCLYDQGVFSLRDLLRAGASDNQIMDAILEAVNSKAKDGFEAAAKRSTISESMATIGG